MLEPERVCGTVWRRARRAPSSRCSAYVYVSHRYLAGRGAGGDVGRGAGRGVSSIDLLLFVRRGGRDG